MSWRFYAQIFTPNGIVISRDIASYGYHVPTLLVQEVDGGPPESKINDLPFKLDA